MAITGFKFTKRKLTIIEEGCHIPSTVKPNPDGYIRVQVGSRKDDTRCTKMYHRLMWEEVHGDIPDKFSIHHLCHTRACCNVEHLELITMSEHASLTNRQRKLNIGELH